MGTGFASRGVRPGERELPRTWRRPAPVKLLVEAAMAGGKVLNSIWCVLTDAPLEEEEVPHAKCSRRSGNREYKKKVGRPRRV